VIAPPAGTWELWRQDDLGHRFLVGRYPNRAAADQCLAELTRSQHKQTYWINPATVDPSEQE
jgi:hypothetical protein